MNNVIDTNSRLFKLYADRMVRKTGCWDHEDVLERPVNICTYVRNIVLQAGYLFLTEFLIAFFFLLLLAFMILTPVLSVGAWLITDNPFIVVFGGWGEFMLVLDLAVLLLLGAAGVSAGCGFLYNKTYNYVMNKPIKREDTMSNTNIVITWIKSVHGKFCVPLKFDRESKNNVVDDQDVS